MSHEQDEILREIIGDVPRVIALAARFMRELDRFPHEPRTDALWAKFHDIKQAAQEALAAAKKAIEQ